MSLLLLSKRFFSRASSSSRMAIKRRCFSSSSSADSSPAMVTCALNGVLTDPAKFNVPVTPDEMAEAAYGAYNEGASAVHIHFRDQREKKGHLPTWEPDVAARVTDAIKTRCPDIIINYTTGTIGDEGVFGGGDLGPVGGPVSCLEAGRPHMAAMNAGSLNYLRATSKGGKWAWPPMMFGNPVEKIQQMVDAMERLDIVPECECFDTGIVRSIKMFHQVGILKKPIHLSLVMGVASGMPAKTEWLPLLLDEIDDDVHWQVIAIGRQDEVWPLLRRASELGGNVRTGLEDTFYLPDGTRAETNAQLVAELVKVVRETGREPAR